MPGRRLDEIRRALAAVRGGSEGADVGGDVTINQDDGLGKRSPNIASEASGYGLCNVHERLLLHYGPDSGLDIDSREGGGTRVAFSIPRWEEAP
ncbi:hypothetical protein D1872_220030 [compost metagenome]